MFEKVNFEEKNQQASTKTLKQKIEDHLRMDVAVFNLFLLRPTVTDIFGVQNFEFQYFRVFQKNENFGGYEDFGGMKILGISQNWTILRGYFYVF